MVLGIISLGCGLTGPIALGLGISALGKINAEPSRYTGKGLAITGIVLGGLTTGLTLLFLLIAVFG